MSSRGRRRANDDDPFIGRHLPPPFAGQHRRSKGKKYIIRAQKYPPHEMTSFTGAGVRGTGRRGGSVSHAVRGENENNTIRQTEYEQSRRWSNEQRNRGRGNVRRAGRSTYGIYSERQAMYGSYYNNAQHPPTIYDLPVSRCNALLDTKPDIDSRDRRNSILPTPSTSSTSDLSDSKRLVRRGGQMNVSPTSSRTPTTRAKQTEMSTALPPRRIQTSETSESEDDNIPSTSSTGQKQSTREYTAPRTMSNVSESRASEAKSTNNSACDSSDSSSSSDDEPGAKAPTRVAPKLTSVQSPQASTVDAFCHRALDSQTTNFRESMLSRTLQSTERQEQHSPIDAAELSSSASIDDVQFIGTIVKREPNDDGVTSKPVNGMTMVPQNELERLRLAERALHLHSRTKMNVEVLLALESKYINMIDKCKKLVTFMQHHQANVDDAAAQLRSESTAGSLDVSLFGSETVILDLARVSSLFAPLERIDGVLSSCNSNDLGEASEALIELTDGRSLEQRQQYGNISPLAKRRREESRTSDVANSQ